MNIVAKNRERTHLEGLPKERKHFSAEFEKEVAGDEIREFSRNQFTQVPTTICGRFYLILKVIASH